MRHDDIIMTKHFHRRQSKVAQNNAKRIRFMFIRVGQLPYLKVGNHHKEEGTMKNAQRQKNQPKHLPWQLTRSISTSELRLCLLHRTIFGWGSLYFRGLQENQHFEGAMQQKFKKVEILLCDSYFFIALLLSLCREAAYFFVLLGSSLNRSIKQEFAFIQDVPYLYILKALYTLGQLDQTKIKRALTNNS